MKKKKSFGKRRLFNFGGKNDIIFTQRIPHLETKKTSERGQSDTRLGRIKAERIEQQIRTRFGKAVVNLFSICYYRKYTSMHT